MFTAYVVSDHPHDIECYIGSHQSETRPLPDATVILLTQFIFDFPICAVKLLLKQRTKVNSQRLPFSVLNVSKVNGHYNSIYEFPTTGLVYGRHNSK